MANIKYYHYHHEGHDYVKHNVAGESNMPYMGIELEVDKGGCSDESATDFDHCFNVHNDPEWLMYEEDGSIDDGFEIITNPATLAFHKSIRASYEDGFKTLVRKGYRSYNTDTCGMHVHVNRDYFGTNEQLQNTCIETVLTICDKFWDELLIFSRRDSYTAERWAGKLNHTPQEIISDMVDGDYDRYSCVNVGGACTIEFRIFKGTMNPHSFFATLELVNNICVYASTHTPSDVERLTWNELLDGEEIGAFWERVKNRIVA